MRILLVTTQYAPELGGVPRLLWLYSQYRPSDVSLRVLSVQQQPPHFYTAFDQEAPFSIERIAPSRWRGFTSLVFLRRLCQLMRQWSPDVILSGVAYPTAVLVWLATLFHCRPYVVYAHSEDVTIQSAARRVLGWALRGATAVLTVSHFTHNELRQMGIPALRLHLVHPGIAVEPFLASPASSSESGQWVLLTVARLVARKGQDAVIRALPTALAQKPNLHYVIVGQGPDEAYLRQLVADLELTNYVTFAGRVSDADLPAYYHACHAFIMLSRPSGSEVEGFGITFLEAGAAGKPVIGGRTGGVVDAVQDEFTGLLVDPLDINAAAAAILRLAQNPVWAQQLGQNGRQYVMQNHTAAVFAAQVTAVLRAGGV